MTGQVENGRRVHLAHPSATTSDPNAALVVAAGKAHLAWHLKDKRAALPAPGDRLAWVEAGLDASAIVLACEMNKARTIATAQIDLSGGKANG